MPNFLSQVHALNLCTPQSAHPRLEARRMRQQAEGFAKSVKKAG
jgi:hypothetical protein